MRIQLYSKFIFMSLAVTSAFIVNFILYKTIQKTLELRFSGILTRAQVVDKDSFKLKFYVQDQVFYFEGQKPIEGIKNQYQDNEPHELEDYENNSDKINSEVEIIYNPNDPTSASTLAQYNFLNSFLVLMMIVFVVLGIAIFGFLRKIILDFKYK